MTKNQIGTKDLSTPNDWIGGKKEAHYGAYCPSPMSKKTVTLRLKLQMYNWSDFKFDPSGKAKREGNRLIIEFLLAQEKIAFILPHCLVLT